MLTVRTNLPLSSDAAERNDAFVELDNDCGTELKEVVLWARSQELEAIRFQCF